MTIKNIPVLYLGIVAVGIVLLVYLTLNSNSVKNSQPYRVPIGMKVAYAVEKSGANESGNIYVYSLADKKTTKIYSYSVPRPKIKEGLVGSSLLRRIGQDILIDIEMGDPANGNVQRYMRLIGLDGVEQNDSPIIKELQAVPVGSSYVVADDLQKVAVQNTQSGQTMGQPIKVWEANGGKEKDYNLAPVIIDNQRYGLIPWRFANNDSALYLQVDGTQAFYAAELDLKTGMVKKLFPDNADFASSTTLAKNGLVVGVVETKKPIDPADEAIVKSQLVLFDTSEGKQKILKQRTDGGTFQLADISPDGKFLLYSDAGDSDSAKKEGFNVLSLQNADNEKHYGISAYHYPVDWLNSDSWALMSPTREDGALLFNIVTGETAKIPNTKVGQGLPSENLIGLFD